MIEILEHTPDGGASCPILIVDDSASCWYAGLRGSPATILDMDGKLYIYIYIHMCL